MHVTHGAQLAAAVAVGQGGGAGLTLGAGGGIDADDLGDVQVHAIVVRGGFAGEAADAGAEGQGGDGDGEGFAKGHDRSPGSAEWGWRLLTA